MYKKKSLTLQEKENYKIILTDIGSILLQFELDSQFNFITYLLNLIDEDEEFIQKLNSVDMWGGSGAVWEVYIPIRSKEIVFIEKLIELINYMELTGTLGKGIKPLRKILKKDVANA